ncbi:MAG: CRTAC1 family protein [Lysobacterales bacterium]
MNTRTSAPSNWSWPEKTGVWALACFGLAGGTAAGAAITLQDIGAQRGIGSYAMAQPMGGGAAAADFDGDGDVDLFIPNEKLIPDQLYVNQGNGFFDERAAALGLDSLLRSRTALWLDVDGDGDLDLIVAGDCQGNSQGTGNPQCDPGFAMMRLYRQENGVFVDATIGSGLEQDSGTMEDGHHRGGMAAGDIDGDGDLDLYVATWNGRSQLFVNNGSGHYTDITISAGVDRPLTSQWQPVMFDVDGDGALDIFVAVDFTDNFLFMNHGNNVFVERAEVAGVNRNWNDMGVAVGDYDNDGDFDMYVTQVYGREPGEHNMLLRNDSTIGNPLFVDVGDSAGVGDTGWGWGATFFDADLDGDLDLAVTNGFVNVHDQSRLFRNDGGDTYTDISTQSGFNDMLWGSSLIAIDAEGDGQLDLLQTCKIHPQPGPLRLLHNATASSNHHLVVVPRANAGNTHAIGARVSVTAGGQTQHRLMSAGISFLGQEPARAHFGLGSATRVDEIKVRWPDGHETSRRSVLADRLLQIPADELHYANFE